MAAGPEALNAMKYLSEASVAGEAMDVFLWTCEKGRANIVSYLLKELHLDVNGQRGLPTIPHSPHCKGRREKL
jgi:hypothetical protein